MKILDILGHTCASKRRRQAHSQDEGSCQPGKAFPCVVKVAVVVVDVVVVVVVVVAVAVAVPGS